MFGHTISSYTDIKSPGSVELRSRISSCLGILENGHQFKILSFFLCTSLSSFPTKLKLLGMILQIRLFELLMNERLFNMWIIIDFLLIFVSKKYLLKTKLP